MLTSTRFPSVPQPPPAICSAGTNLEQGQPQDDFPDYFGAPDAAKDPVGYRLFQLVPCESGANIETGGVAIGMARLQAGRPGENSADACVRTNAALL